MAIVAIPPRDSPPDQGLVRLLGAVLWPSFLSACFGSLLFFAAVDPLALRDSGPRIFDGLSREAGYALGLFFFWAIGLLASATSALLLRNQRSTQ